MLQFPSQYEIPGDVDGINISMEIEKKHSTLWLLFLITFWASGLLQDLEAYGAGVCVASFPLPSYCEGDQLSNNLAYQIIFVFY